MELTQHGHRVLHADRATSAREVPDADLLIGAVLIPDATTPRLVERALGQGGQAIVGAAGGIVAAVAADMGRLAARQAVGLAPVVRLAQSGPAVPALPDDLGVHSVPSRGYSIHRTEGGVGGSSAKLSPLAAPTNWKRASGPMARGSGFR